MLILSVLVEVYACLPNQIKYRFLQLYFRYEYFFEKNECFHFET